MAADPRHAIVRYPGGLRASFRWVGSGGAAALFALSEAGGPLHDLGDRAGDEPDRLCRAELRVETPAGPWTVRLASTISDEPAAIPWDTEGLLVVRYGFHAYALGARDGELRWAHRSASPILAVLGAPRLPHIIVQAEIETFALEPDGTVGWRVGHSDVVTDVELVAGRLVLGSFDGQRRALDPMTGRTAG